MWSASASARRPAPLGLLQLRQQRGSSSGQARLVVLLVVVMLVLLVLLPPSLDFSGARVVVSARPTTTTNFSGLALSLWTQQRRRAAQYCRTCLQMGRSYL